MRVIVRVRPTNDREREQRNVVKVLDDSTLLFDPKEEVEDFYFRGTKQVGRDLSRKANKELRFNFDNVFGADATNEEIHNATTLPILDGLLNGYNCSVFAYGATGAGKTFTMLGDSENPGITFLTVMGLFERLESLRSEMIIDLAISYLEVYNENVKDLFSPNRILQVREDQHRGVIVPGLTLHKPKCPEELLEMLHLGNRRRTQHPTDANAESSRSHAVFTIYVKQQDRTTGSKSGLSAIRVAKMALIDLAGSERASMVSRGNGSRLREGANINKSLLALGNCINALADKKGHVPFRNSKLTRLLKDSLDGNCRTVMIAAVSPTAFTYEDTYNTLKYATRAKIIKTNSKQNVLDLIVPAGQHMKIIQELRDQVANLKQQLNDMPRPIGQPVVVTQQLANKSVNGDEVNSIRVLLELLFAEREALVCQFLDISCRLREMELRMQRRQRCIERLALVSINSDHMDQSASKMDNAVARMIVRRDRQLMQKKIMEQRLAANGVELDKVEKQAVATNSEIISQWLMAQHAKLNTKVAQIREQHACRCTLIQEEEGRRSDKLMTELLIVVQRQYLILLSNGMATSDIMEDFNGILKQAEGLKEVAWADQLNVDNVSKEISNIGSYLNLSIAPLKIPDASEDIVSVSEASNENIQKTEVNSTSSILTKSGARARLYSPTCGKLLTAGCGVADDVLETETTTDGCSTTIALSPVLIEAQAATSDTMLDSTFVKEDLETATNRTGEDVTVGAVLCSGRRLTFDNERPMMTSEIESQKENICLAPLKCPSKLSETSPKKSGGKRRSIEAQRVDSAKKLKSSTSLSNLGTAKNLRKFGFPSMFDKPLQIANGSVRIKLPDFSKLGKLTPQKRTVASNPSLIGSSKRPIISKLNSKLVTQPRMNTLAEKTSGLFHEKTLQLIAPKFAPHKFAKYGVCWFNHCLKQTLQIAPI